jgi:hypothetical protein
MKRENTKTAPLAPYILHKLEQKFCHDILICHCSYTGQYNTHEGLNHYENPKNEERYN